MSLHTEHINDTIREYILSQNPAAPIEDLSKRVLMQVGRYKAPPYWDYVELTTGNRDWYDKLLPALNSESITPILQNTTLITPSTQYEDYKILLKLKPGGRLTTFNRQDCVRHLLEHMVTHNICNGVDAAKVIASEAQVSTISHGDLGS